MIVDELSGELFLKNEGAAAEVIDGYQIDSLSGSLNFGALTSVADNYDLSGDMSVDAISEWFVLATTVNSIVEVSLTTSSGSLAAGEIVSLGNLWTLAGATDLEATIAASGSSSTMPVIFRDLTADYDGNLSVDLLDYDVFVSSYGSTVDLAADGNNDGVIDAADFTVWRDSSALDLSPIASLGTAASEVITPLGSISTLAVAVPEPNSLGLILFSGLSLVVAKQRSSN